MRDIVVALHPVVSSLHARLVPVQAVNASRTVSKVEAVHVSIVMEPLHGGVTVNHTSVPAGETHGNAAVLVAPTLENVALNPSVSGIAVVHSSFATQATAPVTVRL